MTKSQISSKTVFITGASSGIGAACAAHFAQAGARLLLCARNIDRLNEIAMPLKDKHKIDIHTFQLDVRNRAQVQQALKNLPKEWQTIDVLINNAGLARGFEPLQEGNIDDWEEMIDTNVKGLLYVTRAILPAMVARNSGHIINIGSVAGHEAYPKGNAYCASKHAVSALTKCLRMDLLGTKIRVSTVDPGAVETSFSVVRFKGDKERAAAVYKGMQPLTPADVADAVFYCASCPPHVNISEIIIMPTDQASATMVHRKQD